MINLKRTVGRPCAAGWQGLQPLSSFKKCRVQFEFCHIDSHNLSGVSDLLIIAQSPFCRRITATHKGSEESGKIGLHAWHPRITRPTVFEWATEGLLLLRAFWGLWCLWDHGRAKSRHCGTLLEISSIPVLVIIVGSCGRDDDVVWSGLVGLDLPAFVLEPLVELTLSLLLATGSCGFGW